MSATDELRRLLDERGVEWTKPKSATEFIQTTFLRNGWGIEVLERNIGLCVTATNVFDTPEQAITATLGGGKLTAEQVQKAIYKHGINDGFVYSVIKSSFQAIADELNATLDGGECENIAPDYLDFLCSKCGFVHYHSDENDTGDGNDWAHCPKCGKRIRKAVKR